MDTVKLSIPYVKGGEEKLKIMEVTRDTITALKSKKVRVFTLDDQNFNVIWDCFYGDVDDAVEFSKGIKTERLLEEILNIKL